MKMRLFVVAAALAGVTGCGLFGGPDVPEARGPVDYPDLGARPDAAPSAGADERARTVERLQARALRANLDRPVVDLQMAGKLPGPLKVARDPLIPLALRAKPLEQRPQTSAPPPLPSPADLPPSRAAGG